jgi:hypothetical protein
MRIQHSIAAPISESLCEDIFSIAINEAIDEWAIVEWSDLDNYKACIIPRYALVESEETMKERMRQNTMKQDKYLINIDKIGETIATYCNLDCEAIITFCNINFSPTLFRDQLITAVFSNSSSALDSITISHIIQILCFDQIFFP